VEIKIFNNIIMKPYMQRGSGLDKLGLSKSMMGKMKPSILAASVKVPSVVAMGQAKKVLQTFKAM
jgi:hypothetical protein